MTAPNQTDQEMRAAEAAHPATIGELSDYVEALTKREHDYGTCVYAMSLAAVAAFNYVAGQLGVTGFQASCADLDILRRTRRMDGPFMLINGKYMLYPQYDLSEKLAEAMNEWAPWAAEQASKLLQQKSNAHPNVIAHWKRLAALAQKDSAAAAIAENTHG